MGRDPDSFSLVVPLYFLLPLFSSEDLHLPSIFLLEILSSLEEGFLILSMEDIFVPDLINPDSLEDLVGLVDLALLVLIAVLTEDLTEDL